MKATKTAAVLLTLLLAGALNNILIAKPTAASPDVIQVTSGSAIQEAINNAKDGDTILVAGGTFNETLVVNKSVTLIGAGSSNTFIKPPKEKAAVPVITIRANHVIISGFSIQRGLRGIYIQGYNMSTISNNTITSNTVQGVYLNSSYGNALINNTVSLNGFEGIFVWYSRDNLVNGNVVTNNKCVGIDLLDSNNTRISSNVVTFHYNRTLHAQGIWAVESNNNTIERNIILNNAYSIHMTDSGNNTVTGNIIAHGYNGITLDGLDGCYDNSFYHNDFGDNRYQVESYLSVNKWDNGTSGNYWDDYNGTDNNHDGIGDTPYVIDENNQDNYPFMSQWSPSLKDITAPTTTDDYDGLWHNQDFTVTLAAADYSGINATYYRINNAQTISNVSANGPPLITTENASNTLEYWSVDNADNEEKPHKILTGIKLDKTAPNGSIIINNNESNTASPSVTLTLFANDTLSGISQMRFSNDGLAWTLWEPYKSTRIWNLTSDGLRKVYVQYMDNAGLASQLYSDTILLDTTPPTVLMLSPTINGSVMKSPDVTVQWIGTDAGVGIDRYEIRLDSESPIDTQTNSTYTFKGLSDGNHIVNIKAFDKLGWSREIGINFIVNTSPVGGPGYLEEAAVAVTAAIALGIAALYFFKIRKRGKAQSVDTHSS